MALSDTELQEILDKLSPDEQRQLLSKLQESVSLQRQQSRPQVQRQSSLNSIYACIYCGSSSIKKIGFTSKGTQRFLCKDCKRSFSENYSESLRYSHLPEETWREMLRGFMEELSITQIARNVGCSTKTVWLAKLKVNQALMTMLLYRYAF